MTWRRSVDDATLSIPFIPPLPSVDESIRPHTDPVIRSASPPTIVPITDVYPLIGQASENRGRSRSRSPRRLNPNCRDSPSHTPSSRSHTPSSRSRSSCSSGQWRARNAPIVIPIPSCQGPPPPLPPILVYPPEVPSPRSRSPSPWCVRPLSPPSVVWPTQVPKQPVDIVTFHYNKNMAYAPAAKTYDVRFT